MRHDASRKSPLSQRAWWIPRRHRKNGDSARLRRCDGKHYRETKEQLAAGFNSGVSPDGVPWPALKNPRLPGRNQNNKPLLDSFKLFRSVVDEHAEHIEGISGQGATLGTYVEYAGVHQAGSKDGVIPQRKFLGFSKEIKDYATEEVADSLIRQIDNL